MTNSSYAGVHIKWELSGVLYYIYLTFFSVANVFFLVFLVVCLLPKLPAVFWPPQGYWSITNPVSLTATWHRRIPNLINTRLNRMQRVLHSILTGRILLHLRLAVVHDRGNTSRDTPRSVIPVILATILDRAHRDQLLKVVIGPDTWFSGSRSTGTASGDLELRWEPPIRGFW